MSETRKPIGGIRRVWLYEAEGVTALEAREEGYDLLPTAKVSPLELPLIEEQSHYEELQSLQEGLRQVKHTLTLVLNLAEGERLLTEQLVKRASNKGVILRMELTDGSCRWVGWTPELLNEYPLRTLQIDLRTEARRAMLPTISWTLCCTDIRTALPAVKSTTNET